jgi:hypothetical protein
MKHISNFLIILTVLTVASVVASPVSSWKHADKKGNSYIGVSTVQSGKSKEISADNDEYPTDYVFPTNAPMYWKKVGNDIVAMTEAEQAAVNSNLQAEVTVATTGDAQMDAILRTVAKAVDQNAKTYEEVVAIFKSEVDPKKVKDKDKNKNK